MANQIDSERKRLKLKPRKWPYWSSIQSGKSLGYYKNIDERTWQARTRNEDGKYIFKILGDELNIDYDSALTLALKWFENSHGLKSTRYLVVDAVDAYVDELETSGRLRAAQDTRGRLYKHLIPQLGKKELSALTSSQIKKFRNSLVRVSDDVEDVRKSKDTANRIMNMVKAAFNLAYRDENVSIDSAWKKVKSFEGVSRGRILFLSDEDVSDLLKVTSGSFKNLLQAAVQTGARYGELSNVTVRDYSAKNKTVYLEGKTGGRTTFLSSNSVELFSALVKDKKPSDLIFTKSDGNHWGKNHHSRALKSAVIDAGLPPEAIFYSLRHYHISKALLAAIPIQVVAENTGTSIKMIEKHYGKFLNADRQKMFDSVEVSNG